jgi:hypothetical protein
VIQYTGRTGQLSAWANARTGDIKFVDVNGDKKIDANDRVRSDKNSEPRFVFGLSTGLRWKNFDLRALFQGATGGITLYLA